MKKIGLYLVAILPLLWSCTVESTEDEPEGEEETPVEEIQEPDEELQEPIEEENYVIPEFSDASTLTLDMSADELKVTAAMRDFGVDFFTQASKLADADANLVVSPLSATIFMSMLSNITTDEQTTKIAHPSRLRKS